jgi:hypothetical protein
MGKIRNDAKSLLGAQRFRFGAGPVRNFPTVLLGLPCLCLIGSLSGHLTIPFDNEIKSRWQDRSLCMGVDFS